MTATPSTHYPAALELATRRHAGQTRKDGRTPYIAHPVRVVALLRSHGITDDAVLSAAVLHDVVEDTVGSRDEQHALLRDLLAQFGPRVAGLVDELTKAPPGHQTRRQYTESFGRKSAAACLVKLADRLDNLEDWSGMDASFRRPYLGETIDLLDVIEANPAIGGDPHEAAIERLALRLREVCHAGGVREGRHGARRFGNRQAAREA